MQSSQDFQQQSREQAQQPSQPPPGQASRPYQPPEGTYQQPGPQYQQPYQPAQPPYQQPYPAQPYQQPYPGYAGAYPMTGQKDWLTTLLLCLFLGWLGIHRFYTGHTVIGIIQLLTFGGCGIWTIIDLIMILTDSYRDANGLPLAKK